MTNHLTVDSRRPKSAQYLTKNKLQFQTQDVRNIEKEIQKENHTVGSVEHYKISQEFGLIAAEIKLQTQNKGHTKVTAMIDTGAKVSLIEKQFIAAREIEGIIITKEAVDIVAINQDTVKNNGKIEILVKVGTASVKQEMVVVSHYKLPTPLVLGVDYLKRNNSELNIKPTEGESLVEVKIN